MKSKQPWRRHADSPQIPRRTERRPERVKPPFFPWPLIELSDNQHCVHDHRADFSKCSSLQSIQFEFFSVICAYIWKVIKTLCLWININWCKRVNSMQWITGLCGAAARFIHCCASSSMYVYDAYIRKEVFQGRVHRYARGKTFVYIHKRWIGDTK